VEPEETAMLHVKEAVQKAQAYLPEVFGDAPKKDLLLEGVELTDDRKFWKITFSFSSKRQNDIYRNMREYRTIKLRAKDGEFYGARNGAL
jgi:hypothetical protein